MAKLYKHICDCCGKEHMIASTVYNRIINGKQKKCCCSIECSSELKKNGKYIKCDNCGKLFYRRQSHIDRQAKKEQNNFCSVECEMDFKHRECFEIRKCEICGKEFECSKTSSQRFCSIECQGAWQSTQLAELNPRYKRIEVACKWCGNKYMAKRSRVVNGTTSFCSKECRQEYYRNILCKDEAQIAIHRECALNNLTNHVYSTINSAPQKITDELLDELGLKYQREYRVENFCVDNYLPDQNLMIEVMGDFWHCNPSIYDEPTYDIHIRSIDRDKRKHKCIVDNCGIETLYLWEHDLTNDKDKCKRMIQEYVNNNGILDNYHSFNYEKNMIINTEY